MKKMSLTEEEKKELKTINPNKENDWYKACNKIKKRRNINIKMFERLKKIQLPLETKKRKSDFIIKNNFKHNSTKKNVKKILGKILLNA